MFSPRLVQAPDPPQDALAERSDDALMVLAQTGLKRAFETLVTRHATRIIQLCSRFANDTQQGHELAQDVWVLVWQSRQRYQPKTEFLAWLITIARNHCRNHLRRRKIASAQSVSNAAAEPFVSHSDYSAAQLDALLLHEQRRKVRAALAELPEPIQEALLLRFAEELRYDEIAAVVGSGESTLRSRVHHGLRMLKVKLLEGS